MSDVESYDVEKGKITRLKKALIDTQGNIAEAADLCNITRATVYNWIKRNRGLKRLVQELRHARRYGID